MLETNPTVLIIAVVYYICLNEMYIMGQDTHFDKDFRAVFGAYSKVYE